jgi:hypothetical protein
MFEQAFKNIDEALRREAGFTTELDYTEQTSWLLFLKYLDNLCSSLLRHVFKHWERAALKTTSTWVRLKIRSFHFRVSPSKNGSLRNSMPWVRRRSGLSQSTDKNSRHWKY